VTDLVESRVGEGSTSASQIPFADDAETRPRAGRRGHGDRIVRRPGASVPTLEVPEAQDLHKLNINLNGEGTPRETDH